jgi:hypothetical protein
LIEKLPAIRAPDEPAKPMGQGVITFEDLDFDALVCMRCSHQTRQAGNGVRTKLSWDIPDDEQTKTATLRQQIIIQFHKALKESQDDKAISTGYEHSAQWWAPACDTQNREIEGSIVDPLPSGNAGNAAVAALSLVKQVTHWICCINVC